MLIPRYWSRVDGTADTPEGRQFWFVGWGFSETSQADADASARARLAELTAKARSGQEIANWYEYGTRAIREEFIGQIDSVDDAPPAVITRNRYGALILNAPDTMFLDIDVPEPKRTGGFLSRLFGGAPPARDPFAERQAHTVQMLARLGLPSYRIYRTAAGFRVIITDRFFEPDDPQTAHIMEQLRVDGAFAQICRAQQCFRARLTPKPWRCGMSPPSYPFPRTEPRFVQYMDDWIHRYQRAGTQYATCHLVASAGESSTLPDIQNILTHHDQHTKARSNLTLA